MEPSISTTSESQAPATILDVQATDLPTLSQSASKVATVHGKVSEVVLHPAGHILFINFEGVPRTGFLAIVLKENLDAVHAAFNGDLNAAIRGRNVRITGQIVLYKDRPEIIISRADQIQLD
jgi:DNA/RNA endonuclease YhcR with UshA esterase domain